MLTFNYLKCMNIPCGHLSLILFWGVKFSGFRLAKTSVNKRLLTMSCHSFRNDATKLHHFFVKTKKLKKI